MDAITILIQENGRATVIRAGSNETAKLERFIVTLTFDGTDLRAERVQSFDLVPRGPISAPPLPEAKLYFDADELKRDGAAE